MAMTTWLAGTGQGLYESADGAVWKHTHAYDYRITGIARSAQRLCASEGGGLWEVLPNGWIQRHDETLTEVMDVAFIPGDPGLVAASAYGVASGYRDENGAVRWAWHSDDLPVNARYTHAIGVETPDRWVIATEAGVRVTDDAGRTWQHSGLSGCAVRALRRMGDGWWAGADGRGIWRSEDALTWVRTGRGFETVSAFAFASAGEDILVGTDQGVLIGTGTGPWRKAGLHTCVASVAAHPQAPGFWAAGCQPGGLWVTRDAGASWQNMPGVPGAEIILPPEATS